MRQWRDGVKMMTLGCGKPELLANINDNQVRHKSRFYLPVKQNKALCLVCSPILRIMEKKKTDVKRLTFEIAQTGVQ
jgi:hypothetical protein